MNNIKSVTLVFNDKGETFEEKVIKILEKYINEDFSIDFKNDSYDNSLDR